MQQIIIHINNGKSWVVLWKEGEALFGESKIRKYIAVVWVLCFIGVWLIFNGVLPKHEFETYLNQIEKSVAAKDWDKAKQSMEQLKDIYEGRRFFIQINNASEIFATFELTIGQLEATINNQQDSAIEYVGALRYSLDFVMKAFSGP